MEEALLDAPEDGTVKEVAPALIALHPLDKFVVVAVGSALRIFDFIGNCTVSCLDKTDGPSHMDAIRSICFDTEGKLFASAGDDKLVKIWSADSWHCIKTMRSEKRVSATSFSRDGRFLMFADKFGVVWIMTTLNADNGLNCKLNNAEPLLAHCCSIITGLEISPNGRFIATADRDYKIRVSVFPKNPLGGSHEIESFCLGHTNFVSCISFFGIQADFPELLISGGGDATVRLWHYMTGELLDTFEAGTMVGLDKYTDKVGNHTSSAVTDLSVSSNGSIVAVGIESFCGVLLLSCNRQSRQLALLEKVGLPENFIPTSLAFDHFSTKLWMVSGAAEMVQMDGMSATESEVKASTISAFATARVRVMSIVHVGSDNHLEARVLEYDAVPGGEKLLKTLQGDQNDVEAATAAAEAANAALRNLLIKRQYSTETREHRKKKRNDKKLKRRT
eukprot:Gb_28259 [translate_table: standard]